MTRADPGAIAIAAFAGASAWISFATLAVTNHQPARLGALPPWWTLVLLIALAAASAWATRLRISAAWPLTLTTLLWLPWLPTIVPAAFLIWQGPLEALVWLLAFGGVVVSRSGATLAAAVWWRDPKRAPWIAAAVFFLCAIGAGGALHRYLPGGDEPHYLVITQSLLYDGDLKIENNHERGDFFEYVAAPIRPDFLRRGQDGQIYSVHAPGVSAVVLPAYAVAGYRGVLLFVCLISAGAVALLWKIALLVSDSVGAAWAATLAVAFGATYFLHSFTVFPDPIGAVAVAVALFVFVRLDIAANTVTARHLLIAGCCLALLPWLHTRFAVIAAAFGAVFVTRLLRATSVPTSVPTPTGDLRPHNSQEPSSPLPPRTSIPAFASVPLLSAAAWFWFFFVIYGTPSPAAPYGSGRQSALEWMATGLTGVAFDQQFGLFANSPVLAFSAFGFLTLWRNRSRLAVELLVIGVPYILVVASFGMWWGGWSAPARFLTATMPLLIPPMAAAWHASTVAGRALFVALASVGIANVWARVVVERGGLLYNFRDGFDLLLDWSSRSVNLPLAFPSIHRLGIGPTLMLGAIWIAGAHAALLALRLVLRRPALSRGARWALTSWTAIVAATMAMTISWRVSAAESLTSESSLIEFLHQWRPERRPIIMRLPSMSLLSPGGALGEIELRTSVRARGTGNDRPLLALTHLPAGEYVVVVDGTRDLEGKLVVGVGSESQSIEEWTLDGMRAGDTALRLALPTLAQSLTIRGDDRAKASIRHLGLRPARVFVDGAFSDRDALRAARYRTTRLFFLDDAMYMEPNGVWTRGNSTGEFVLATDDATPIDLDVAAGAKQTTVEFSGPTPLPALVLSPGEHRRVQLSNGVWKVKTTGMFRPKDYDIANGDARPLGARLEFP